MRFGPQLGDITSIFIRSVYLNLERLVDAFAYKEEGTNVFQGCLDSSLFLPTRGVKHAGVWTHIELNLPEVHEQQLLEAFRPIPPCHQNHCIFFARSSAQHYRNRVRGYLTYVFRNLSSCTRAVTADERLNERDLDDSTNSHLAILDNEHVRIRLAALEGHPFRVTAPQTFRIVSTETWRKARRHRARKGEVLSL